MRWLLLVLTLLFSVSANADSLLLLGVGSGLKAAASYTGPGDIVSGATAWYGLRAYNAAYATGSNNAINVRRASDNSTSNIVILSNGNLDVASYNSFVGTDVTASCTLAGTSAACTGASATIHVNDPVTGVGLTQPCTVTATNGSTTATISLAGTSTSCGTVGVAETFTFQVAGFVTEVYDQSGSSYHATQATSAAQPQLLPNCNNSKPCISFVLANSQTLQSGAITSVAQPYTAVSVNNRTGGTSSVGTMISTYSPGALMEYEVFASTNNMTLFAGSFTAQIVAPGSVWHAIQGIYNGTSSIINVDNTLSTGLSSGTNATGTTGFSIGARNGAGGNYLTGYIGETGYWPSGFTTQQQTNSCHNIYAYWSTTTAC